jgi:drug/metabolite transporter (DMT)-like permease
MMASLPAERRHSVLLALLVLIWAVSWPVIKIGVTTVSPIWYGCVRYVIGAVCLFGFVALRRELVVPSRSDWRLVAVSGVLQMGVYSALSGLALTRLPPGRASVLAFSTPLWVVPLAAWRLHEHITRRALIGVGVGLLGVLVIAAPAIQRNGTGQILPYAMLMGAAAAWAISIVFVRAHRFDATPLVLAPWQMLVAATLLCPLAIAVEGGAPSIGMRAMATLAYVGPLSTAFAYWAVVEVGRHFRASTISMALLATPSLGLSISALTLGETVSVSLVVGVILVAAGIRLATMGGRPVKSASPSSAGGRLAGRRASAP